MIETEEKISINWKEKYKELKEEYDWLWEEWKNLVNKIHFHT